MQPQVTKLAPAPPRWGVAFDKFRHIDEQSPVSVRKTRTGFVSTGIGFEDYAPGEKGKPGGGMHVFRPGQLSAPRQTPTPVWARNDSELRKLIVEFMENSLGLRPEVGATLQDRLTRAQKELEDRRPHLDGLLTALCKEYVLMKNTFYGERKASRLRKLQWQIDNIDTQLLLLNRKAAVLIGIVYFYWRANMNSVGVAEQLKIRPTLVRQILHRLGKLWTNLQNPLWVPKYQKTYMSRFIWAGKQQGRLLILELHTEEFLPVDVIYKMQPRSLIALHEWDNGGPQKEFWVNDSNLVHLRWRKAILRKTPTYLSWKVKCECGKQFVITETKLRCATSCGCTT